MLKGHLAIADNLLEREGVDVNIKNDEGRTLVAQAVSGEISESTLVQLQYLVVKKGANVTTADFMGHTPLHLLAKHYNLHNKGREGADDDDHFGGSEDESEEENEDGSSGGEDNADPMEDEEPLRSKKRGRGSKDKEKADADDDDKSAKGKKKEKEKEKEDLSVQIARILLDNGADVNALSQVKRLFNLFTMPSCSPPPPFEG